MTQHTFLELYKFVRAITYRKLIPTVNASKRFEQVDLLKTPLNLKPVKLTIPSSVQNL